MLQFNFVGRLLGPRGNSLKRLESNTGCRIFIRGRGSIRDAVKVTVSLVHLRKILVWKHFGSLIDQSLSCLCLNMNDVRCTSMTVGYCTMISYPWIWFLLLFRTLYWYVKWWLLHLILETLKYGDLTFSVSGTFARLDSTLYIIYKRNFQALVWMYKILKRPSYACINHNSGCTS